MARQAFPSGLRGSVPSWATPGNIDALTRVDSSSSTQVTQLLSPPWLPIHTYFVTYLPYLLTQDFLNTGAGTGTIAGQVLLKP